MLMSTNTNIKDMVLDSIQEDVLHVQAEELAKMLLFWELI